MRKFKVIVDSLSPYLMNKFDEKEADNKIRKNAPKEYKDKEECEKRLNFTSDGKIYISSSQVHGCLINAGKDLKIKGKKSATYSKVFGAFVLIEPAELILSPQKWTTDKRAVVVQKARIMRSRPRWDKWSLEFTATLMDNDIPMEVLKEGLDNGGKYIGIGDFRPEKKGPFGRFMVTEFKEVK